MSSLEKKLLSRYSSEMQVQQFLIENGFGDYAELFKRYSGDKILCAKEESILEIIPLVQPGCRLCALLSYCRYVDGENFCYFGRN